MTSICSAHIDLVPGCPRCYPRTGSWPTPQQIATLIEVERNAWIAYIESDPSDEDLLDASVSSLDRIYAYFVVHGLMEVDQTRRTRR